MLKKLFVTAAAAAAVSVPLAGVASADPADPPSDQSSNAADGNGIGDEGGVPQKTGTYLHDSYPELSGVVDGFSGDPVPSGFAFQQVAKTPGNLPDAYGVFLTNFYQTTGHLPDGTPTPAGFTVSRTVPGSVVKLFTPGCGHGSKPQPAACVN
jgi:hypothetical protein